MSNNSDHTKNRTIIERLLPEVYRSEINNSLFGSAFDKHLTPDDTVRVAGYVGQGNPKAHVKRQIEEPTPHRQAYQLEPVMHVGVGTEDVVLSQHGFLKQLELMGVDVNRLPEWGNTTQFNWIPPINIDMLINYADYYWKPSVPGEAPQYLTIEGRCRKAYSKVSAYDTILDQYGAIIPIYSVNAKTNTFTLQGRYNSLLIPSFIFYTKNTTDINLRNKFWHVAESTYDATSGFTTVIPIESMAIHQGTPPTVSQIGRWWHNTTTNELLSWSGTAWIPATSAVTVDLSLTELRAVYQADADCACSGSYGWDIGQWDDGQISSVLWNESLLASISFDTESEWITENGAPTDGDIWFDITTDTLKQYVSGWVVVNEAFSTTIQETRGVFAWDSSKACDIQEPNEWSAHNNWIHKTSVTSTDGIIRAQLPILEYGSTVELNEWTEVSRRWKYRKDIDTPFDFSITPPSRFELEPIRRFVVTVGTEYTIELDDKYTHDLNLAQLFVPGFRFRVVDDAGSDTYVVKSTITKGTPATGISTIVTIEGNTYSSALSGGGPSNARIEPLLTVNGDVWRGYHVHWVLDLASVEFIPAPAIQENFLLKAAITSPNYQGQDIYGHNVVWSNYHQETTLVSPLLSTDVLGLVPTLQYVDSMVTAGMFEVGVAYRIESIGTTNFVSVGAASNTVGLVFVATGVGTGTGTAINISHNFVLPKTELRVYINDVRQYGTYTEIESSPILTTTQVGTDEYNNITFKYVTGIRFNEAVDQYKQIRIEVAPAAHVDMGWAAIPVRTVEDEAEFASKLGSGLQPQYMSLVQYSKKEQAKTQINQYPLFNMYDVHGDLVTASSLFSYSEDPSYEVNANIQRRIIRSTDGRDYLFNQHLVSADNGEIYAFRNLFLLKQYDENLFWVDSYHNQVKFWDGTAWASIYINTDTGVQFIPVISNTAPTMYYGADDVGALWFNTVNHVLSQYNGTIWESIPFVDGGTDPLLQTIWRRGLNNEQYIPEYVDKDRVPVAIGSASGDWEMLDQWYYNSEHHNYQVVKLTELITHLSSIVQQQPSIPGLAGSGAYTLTHNAYNYGVGGTIKEHNDSFDTLISAVNVKNITPVGVIEFAEDQYNTLQLQIRDILNRMSIDLFSSYSTANLINQTDTIAKAVISAYAINDFATMVYGDTSAYDPITGNGVKNWIVTPPIMGLAPATVPHIINETGFTEVYHHDGHRVVVSYTPVEEDRFARNLCKTVDPRVGNSTLGIISTATPPVTGAAFTAVYGGTDPRVGVYWYKTGGGSAQLYRFTAYAVAAFPPPVISGGIELPDGVRYFNSTFLTTYEKQGLAWVPITSNGADDITPLWTTVTLRQTLAEIYYAIELELYKIATVRYAPAFDYNTLVPDVDAQQLYDEYVQRRFEAYVASHRIETPLANNNYSPSNAFSWNYASSLPDAPPRSGLTHQPFASWQALYDSWFGTPYPHLEPWTLQGYTGKPDWWDDEYKDTTGVRRWKYNHLTSTGMWNNILTGVVPAGYALPSLAISTGTPSQTTTYDYIPVNISDSAIAGNYQPDALLPPYYDNSAIAWTMPMIRSLFVDRHSQIIGPNADYVYGDNGPVEWTWKTSTEWVYDRLIVAFLMQPTRFFQAAFGLNLLLIDGLQVDSTTKQVYTHENVLFHGDVYGNNEQYHADGINQWYVNFNRYSGYDTNTEFRELWAGWTPRLSYQSASIIDTSTFEVFSKYMDIGTQDYEVVLANTGVVSDSWADSFQIDVLGIPPAIIQYNNQNLWKFSIDTAAAIDREMRAYGVQQYPVLVSAATNTFTTFSFSMLSADSATRRFYVDGNQQHVFVNGVTITVSGTAHNDGTYNVVNAVFEPNANHTRITVDSSVVTETAAGSIDIANFILPWETGDMVFVATTKMMPAPIRADVPYYVIKTSNRSFKLATSQQEALSGVFVDVVMAGQGNITVGKVAASFKVYGGAGLSSEVWYHFEIDRNTTYSIMPPLSVYGIQTIINMIDGYSTMAADNGIVFNAGAGGETDPTTGRAVSWQLEIERFIEFLFSIRNTQLSIEDRFEFVVDDISTNELSFTGAVPVWSVGQEMVFTTTGTLPTPLFAGTPYYYIPGSGGKFTISFSKVPTSTSTVDITATGSGKLYVSRYHVQAAYPQFEVNPIRNNVWISTPEGWLSDIIAGPYSDIRTNQTIYDQYGRPITPDKLLVYRQDRQSRITILPELPNDVQPGLTVLDDPYNYLHIGGCHLFTEGYEHIIMFNDYTAGGLIYDSFIGLSTKKFDVDLQKSAVFSLRPTLGGFYLRGGKFHRNMEGSTTDLRNVYDTFTVPELRTETKYARALLGYGGNKDYYDLVNLNSKSQFLFYRGMIQLKGAVNAMKAYINSRRFVDAKLDEYWAWKIAEFGDYRPRVYPALKLYAEDGGLPDVRVEFTDTSVPVDTTHTSNNFEIVSFESGHNTRWDVMPETRTDLSTSPLFLEGHVFKLDRIFVGDTLPLDQQPLVDYWYDTDEPISANRFKTSAGIPIIGSTNNISTSSFIFAHGNHSDVTIIVPRKLTDTSTGIDLTRYTLGTPIQAGTSVGDYTIADISTDVLEINMGASGTNQVLMVYYINHAANDNSPCTVIDKKSNAVLSQAQYWDPARGHHSSTAIHNVDVLLGTDSALYTDNLVIANANSDRAWNKTEVGTRWLDTSTLEYTPYYDSRIISNNDQRLAQWGTLAGWASTHVREWTASSIIPSRWDAQADIEESDPTIPSEYRATGNVWQQTYKRTRVTYTTLSILVDEITTNAAVDLTTDDTVLFVGETMPTLTIGGALEQGVQYYVVDVSLSGTVIKVSNEYGGTPLTFATPGTNVVVVPTFRPTDWELAPIHRQKIYAALNQSTFVGSLTSIPVVGFDEADVVDVYINGVMAAAAVSVVANTITFNTVVVVRACDVIDVIRPEYLPTADELDFNPDVEDDGTIHVQWNRYTPYTTMSEVNPSGNMVTMYYFWTEKGVTRDTTRVTPLSLTEVEQQLVTIPTPYYIVQKPLSTVPVEYSITAPYNITPITYRRAVLRNANAYITDDDRFIWRFTHDATLRDDLDYGVSQLSLKNKHAEWLMLRQEQPSSIPRALWDRVTESIVGYKLSNHLLRVPALDRVLYDDMYGTDTQYGLGTDQTFVDGTLALSTILAYIQDSNVDFSPMNIDDFFARNDFTTPVGIESAMDEIYRSFGAKHVNRMWFSTLFDAMTTKDKYRELFKTSWVALHGIRVLEVGGLFDD